MESLAAAEAERAHDEEPGDVHHHHGNAHPAVPENQIKIKRHGGREMITDRHGLAGDGACAFMSPHKHGTRNGETPA